MRKKWLLLPGWFAAWALALGACSPENFDSTKDYDVVVTFYDTDYNFAQNRTYAMPNVVYDLSDSDAGVIDSEKGYDEAILNNIADRMAFYGYTRLPDPRDPAVDVVVTAGAVSSEYWVYGADSWWWYDPWYWWYYYPITVIPINYPVGSVVIAMVDPELADWENRQIPMSWSAGMRSILNNNVANQIRTSIEQAFAQSPYLRVGNPVPPIYDPELDGGVDGGETGDGGL